MNDERPVTCEICGTPDPWCKCKDEDLIRYLRAEVARTKEWLDDARTVSQMHLIEVTRLTAEVELLEELDDEKSDTCTALGKTAENFAGQLAAVTAERDALREVAQALLGAMPYSIQHKWPNIVTKAKEALKGEK